MAKIGSHSSQHQAFTNNQDASLQGDNLHQPIQDKGHLSKRTLKAVYPHFNENSKRMSTERSLNYPDDHLKNMDKISQKDETIQKIHGQLSRIYKN